MSHPIPDCLGPRAHVTPPRWRPPAGCWDTQFHVLGPQERFPYFAQRHYTPPTAPLDAYLRMLAVLGIDHAFVVHANTQGPDNEIYLQAVAQRPQHLVAVVKADGSVTPEQFRKLHARGARGVRFGFNPQHHNGALDRGTVQQMIDRTRDRGWFVQLHCDGAALPALEDWIAGLQAPVVIDHLGRVDAAAGLDAAPQRALLRLATLPHVWIKISGLDRICPAGDPYEEAGPLVSRLAESARDRLLWGSDWPHTGVFDDSRMPDDGRLFDAFLSFFPREQDRLAILKSNPLRLLGRG